MSEEAEQIPQDVEQDYPIQQPPTQEEASLFCPRIITLVFDGASASLGASISSSTLFYHSISSQRKRSPWKLGCPLGITV